jgi:endoglucanase
MPGPAQTVLPRWRGFNLLEMFHTKSSCQWQEDDFRWIAGWGFDFVRLPLCYLLWVEDEDPFRITEEGLANIDRAVRLGERCGLHVCLNLHRAPGYSVNREREEPFDLWKDHAARDAFCLHWSTLARRYRGIPTERLSFNLVNEPQAPSTNGMTREDHQRVITAAVQAIRTVDPDRLIIADGLAWGTAPCPELTTLGLAQSCRAYAPMGISHYEASWINSEGMPEPEWPGALHGNEPWDRRRLERHYEPWARLARQGVGIHCGEGGAYNRTPHDVVLAWLRDVLEILAGLGIGCALWNFRGPFGILDSGRKDVDYSDWHGHKLDRQLLLLLQEF